MRTDTRLTVSISGLVVLLGSWGLAQAQTPKGSLPDLSPVIGERIEVTVEDGSVLTGQLIRASEAGVVLEVDQKQTELQSRQIRGISRWEGDSVKNGILIGTGLGFLIPALISSGIDTGEPGEAAALLIPPGVAIGLAVGWIVDASRHRKVQIFPATASHVVVAPLLAAGRKGVAVRLRF